MQKTKFKFIILFLLLTLIISSTSCLALTSNKNVKMEIVENNVCTININDYAKFEKKMIDYDLDKKEITMQLKISNTPGPSFDKPAEVILLIDNSESMIQREVTPGNQRLNVVLNSAKTLASALLQNPYAKVGVVKFSTDPDVTNEGTISDARLLTVPTSDSAAVLDAIDSIATGTLGPRTDIDAGLQVAKANFSDDDSDKYLVLLSDGVPNTAVGGPTFTYSEDVATKTQNTLLSYKTSGINVYTMMTGIDQTTEPSTGMTYRELAEEIFGTSSEPTVGKFYYITDNQIEKTICEDILNDITKTIDSTLTDVKIYDYFPQEIVDNFDFSYVKRPTLGTISDTIDENNCIVWSIDVLGPTDSDTVEYKLTLKENIDESILFKILKTNEKVDITSRQEPAKTSNEAPKIKLTEKSTVTVKYLDKETNKPVAEETIIKGDVGSNYTTERKKVDGYVAADPEPTNKEGVITEEPITVIYYYTVSKAPTPIPQTGDVNIPMVIAGSVLVIAVAGFGIKLYTLRKK